MCLLDIPCEFRALPHSLQTYLALHWTAASPSCSLWAAPLSSFSLWVSWPEGAGRSSSPAWHPLLLSEKEEMKMISVWVNTAALVWGKTYDYDIPQRHVKHESCMRFR